MPIPVDAARGWNNYLLDGGRVLVTAFDSCHNNDCHRLCGDIQTDGIHKSYLDTMHRRLNPELKIAMWHHSLDDPPLQSSYMDVSHMTTLMDRGYRLGVHGHQHKSDAQPHSLFLSGTYTMSIVCAGSLCAGAENLPHGFVRQYNVIELDDDYGGGTVHVREMRHHGVFSPGRIPSVGHSSFGRVEWTKAPRDITVNTARGGGADTVMVDAIESLIRAGDLEIAEAEIQRNMHVLDRYGFQLLTRVLEKAQRWDDLEQLIDPPNGAEELALLIAVKRKKRDWDGALIVVEAAAASGLYSDSFLRDLRETIALERKASS